MADQPHKYKAGHNDFFRYNFWAFLKQFWSFSRSAPRKTSKRSYHHFNLTTFLKANLLNWRYYRISYIEVDWCYTKCDSSSRNWFNRSRSRLLFARGHLPRWWIVTRHIFSKNLFRITIDFQKSFKTYRLDCQNCHNWLCKSFRSLSVSSLQEEL